VQESLGGNSKTSLLVTCSPHVYNVEETVSTLEFATRCAHSSRLPLCAADAACCPVPRRSSCARTSTNRCRPRSWLPSLPSCARRRLPWKRASVSPARAPV
jgi:hypothetical protein